MKLRLEIHKKLNQYYRRRRKANNQLCFLPWKLFQQDFISTITTLSNEHNSIYQIALREKSNEKKGQKGFHKITVTSSSLSRLNRIHVTNNLTTFNLISMNPTHLQNKKWLTWPHYTKDNAFQPVSSKFSPKTERRHEDLRIVGVSIVDQRDETVKSSIRHSSPKLLNVQNL